MHQRYNQCRHCFIILTQDSYSHFSHALCHLLYITTTIQPIMYLSQDHIQKSQEYHSTSDQIQAFRRLPELQSVLPEFLQLLVIRTSWIQLVTRTSYSHLLTIFTSLVIRTAELVELPMITPYHLCYSPYSHEWDILKVAILLINNEMI